MWTIGSIPGTRRAPRGVLMLLCATSLLACDRSSSGGQKAEKAIPANGVEGILDKAMDDATKEAGAEHLFDPEDKELRKRACDFLTADMVSKLFGVPAAELKQTKALGCIYTWRKDGQLLDAKLMMIRVHKTQTMAATWFKNVTSTKTKEQMNAEMDLVKEKVQERKELDTDLKKKTAASLTDVAKMGTPDEGVRYDDVPGLADEARISSADGVIWTRLGNMTFQIGAYKGPDQPKPEIDPKNLKGIIKAAMENQKKWTKDTLEQRKQAAKKLAPLVVKAISKR